MWTWGQASTQPNVSEVCPHKSRCQCQCPVPLHLGICASILLLGCGAQSTVNWCVLCRFTQMYAGKYRHVQVCAYRYIYISACHVCGYIYTYTNTYRCVGIYMCAHIHTIIFRCIQVLTYVCRYIQMCASVCHCVHVWIHTYIYKYTQVYVGSYMCVYIHIVMFR